MGDVQSTQRGSRQDEGAEEESRGVDNPQTEQNTKHETFRNSEQSSEISRKGEEVRMNGCHEDQNGAQEAAPETQMKEEEAQGEVHDDGVHLEISELDVKQGDINSLGRFFSNIGLKLTINRGSGEKREDDNKETDKEESEKTETEKTEDKTEAEVEQDSSDPTGLILTAVAAGNVLENADERAETSEEPELDAESEQEPHSTNPTGPGDVEIDSPVRRFFATGIFSGLWKKKEAGDETTEKESEEKGDNQVPETAGQTDEEPTSPGELRGEIPEESPEPDNVASPERDRVQMSPLLRFLSGSSLRRLSTKQRNVKSSEARLCDSGEPDPAELLPSEPAEDRRNASAPASGEAGKDEEEEEKEEEGAWASFKRFMSPKPRMKKSLRGAQETEQPASAEEPRAAQTSDHSPEEGKRRKNSSVSWEAVLCGSGRRRSRKTSDSEDEIPPIDLKQRREDGGPKSGEDSGAENGKETTAPKLDGSPQEEDRTSTWKSLKRIVTPKRKSRDEDEAIKTKTQSEGEGGQENPSFSIKNLLPGRKKQRSEESQGRASPDEAEKDRASDDDDSETPGVVPLSEFEVDEEENQSVEETEKLELQQDEETDKNLCLPQDLDEGSEKQDTNQEPDDGTELASKHQQLSIISEEGVITEPWATLASALTAAEPAADLTLQDDTEMFTAASQFSSESAKTSGNATPAPAERQAVQTETVLLQVAETFSGSPERRESSQEEGSSELAGSVSEVAFEELDSTDHTEVEDEEPPSAEEEDVQELVKELAEGLASEGGNKTGEKEIREAGDEMLTLAEANIGAGDAKQVEEPEKEGPAEGLGPPPQPQVIYGNVGKCLGTETGGEKPEQGTCLFTEVILKQEDAKSVEELRDLRAEQVSSSNHQEDNTASPEPLVISENPATAETAKDEADEADGSAEAPQEPDVLRAVQGLSSDVGEVSILYLETEAASTETSENIGVSDDTVKLQEVTGCTGLTEDSHQLVDASKTVEEPEASQAASSLASGNGDVSSVETEQKAHNILQEELVVEENKKESIIPKDTPESEEAATISEEPEAMKAAWSPALGSEEAQGLPPETQIILKADLDTDEDTKATKLMAGDACEEPVDEGRNVRMPVHPAAEESEVPPLVKEKEPVPDEPRRETILSDPKLQSVDPSESDEEAEGPQSSESAELEITPEIILTEETVSDEPKEELKHHSEITLEPEEPSETDGEAAVSQVLQQFLESEESKEEPSDNISGEETVPGEPRGETRSEPVEESRTVEAVEEPTQTVKASYWVSEDSSGSSPKAEETSEKIQRADSDPGEHKVETVLMTEEPEVSQTVQSSSGQSEDTSVPSAELEITPEIILTEETVPDEPKEELKLHSEVTLGPEEPSKTDGEAAVSQVLQQSLESEESKEEPSDNISGEETVPGEPRDETTVAGETSSEPVEESKTVEAVEEVEAVEASAVMSEDNNRSTPTTEGTSENIPTELDTAENQVEPVPVMVDAFEAGEEPEILQTVLLSSLKLEDNSVPSAEPEIPAEIILTEETVVEEAGYETTAAGETIIEPADDSKTADVVEELESVETSSLDREESSISPDEPEETPENTESDKDENKTETLLHNESPTEPEDAAKVLKEPEELEAVLQAERQTLMKEEPAADEPKDVQLVVTEGFFEKVDDYKTLQMSSVDLEESSISSSGPEASSKNVLQADLDTDQHKTQTTFITEDTSEPLEDPQKAEGAELAPRVQPSSEDTEKIHVCLLEAEEISQSTSQAETVPHETNEENRIDPEDLENVEELESEDPSLVKEAPCDHALEEKPLSDEPKLETFLSDINLQSVDPSETDGEAAVSQVLQQSLESEESKEEPSDNISGEETVPGEPRGETSSEPVDESRTVEAVEEPTQTVKASYWVSEDSSGSSPKAEETSEKIQRADSDPGEHKVETVLMTEEPEVSQTVQSSSGQSEDTSVPSAELEITPEIILTEEPVPDEPKEELKLHSDVTLEPEEPSKTDGEAAVSQVLQQSLESEESKEEPSENISGEETVPGERRDETTVAGETSSEPVEESKTVEAVEEVEAVAASAVMSEDNIRSTPTTEGTSENIPTEPDTAENQVEPVPVVVEAFEAGEEPEILQTVLLSSLKLEDNSVPSAEPEIPAEIILTEETAPEKLKLQTEITLEPEEPSETDGEAEALKDVHPQPVELEESREQSPEEEVTTSDNISEETTGEPRHETTAAGETSSEPADDSKTDEVVEEPETVETSSLVKDESSISPDEPEETSENILKTESGVDENRVETCLVTEEPPEFSQTVRSSALESEDTSVPSAEEITSKIVLSEETVPGEPRGETSSEPVEESRTVEAVEEAEAVEASAVMSEDNIRSTPTTDGTSENIPTEPDTAENQVEPVPVVVEAFEAAEEPEILQTVLLSSLKLEDNSVPSAEPEIPAEIILTEETVVEEAGYETTAAGETIIEPADDSKTADVVEELESVETSSLDREESSISPDEPEETPENILKTESGVDENRVETCLVTGEPPEFSQTVRSSALESEDTSVPSAEEITSKIVLSEETVPDEPGDKTAAVGEAICGQEPDENAKEHESSSPPPEAEETSDTLKAETGSEETKKEITLNPEDTESADGAEAVTAVDPTPESEHLAKEATWAHIPEEMVPGGHEEEPINDILELTQDPLVPWLESGELEVTSNNVPQAETGTVLLSDVRLKPADVQEPEVLEAVQAASFESVEANDGGQVTPEHTPKAEPEEEDLPVETTTDDPKTEQVEEDKCSGTEREPVEDEDPSALNMDTCQDVSIEEPENLRKQTSEALMHAMQAEEEVKEEVEAARPSVKGGVEEVEGGKAEDTAEEAVVDAATSEGTTADSVVEVEDKGLSEEEKEQVGDQVEEKESTTVQGEASHSSPVAGAKEEDEWMDAEENIQAETAGSSYEVEEPLGPQRGGEDVEQAGLERGKEAAHASRTEAEGREDTKKADEAGGFESEEEDFDVALEQPGNRSVAAAFLTG